MKFLILQMVKREVPIEKVGEVASASIQVF